MLKCQVDIWKSLALVEKFIEWLDDKVFFRKGHFLRKISLPNNTLCLQSVGEIPRKDNSIILLLWLALPSRK